MRAWWREEGLCWGERDAPSLVADDEVLVRVVVTGLCRTDVAVALGRIPCVDRCIVGHEIAGIAEKLGRSVTSLREGDRVACLPIVDGRRLGIERDGGFAEYIVLPERALVPVPATLGWRRAAFVEPVAACLAVDRAPLRGSVRVVGEGRIATLTRRILTRLGHHDAPGQVDVAVETGGTAASLAAAQHAVRPGGAIVLKSRPAAPVALDLADAVQRELRLYGVGWAPFPDAIALLSGGLAVDDLLGPVHPLESLADHLSADETRKVFFAPDPSRCVD